MQIHELKPTHRPKKKKRIGRGGKRGTYSGRGMKGQKSRAGAKIKPMERELLLRIPKLRGLGFSLPRRRKQRVELSVKELEKRFENGASITPWVLVEKGMVERYAGKIPEVKLLGSGPIAKKFLVENCAVSKGAKEAIEKAGGTILIKN